MANDGLTVINNDSLRGILAPADVLSKKVLEDMIDFVELSSEASEKESEERISEADADNSWESLEDVRRESEESD